MSQHDVYVWTSTVGASSAKQREVAPGVILDFDDQDHLVGVEVIGALALEADGKRIGGWT